MLTLNNPIIKQENGTIFHVNRIHFNFDESKANFEWIIKDENGGIVIAGASVLEDKIEDVQNGVIEGPDGEMPNMVKVQKKYFTNWYNQEYTTHEALIKKVAELAGFSGEYCGELI